MNVSTMRLLWGTHVSRSYMIFIGDVHVHMLESWLEGLWMVDVKGRHCSADSEVRVRYSDHGHLFIYRPR